MNYRQWKKNYKKQHGYNPPLEVDKRKQAKLVRKYMREYAKIDYGQLASNFVKAVQQIVKEIKPAIAHMCDILATEFTNVAKNLRDEENEE